MAVFAVLGYFQGPKLTTGQVDTTRVATQPAQQLRLFANQNVTAVHHDQVAVVPSVPFSVSSSGEVIALQFANRLDYGTHYSVTVTGVNNGFQPNGSTFTFAFDTTPAQVYYLDRAHQAAGGDQADSIIRISLASAAGGGAQTTLYSAPHIQQFAVFANAIAVTTLNADGTTKLSLVISGENVSEQLLLPGPGVVGSLAVAPTSGILGFTFTSAGPAAQRMYSNTLMTADLSGAHTVAPVPGVDGKPMDVSNWVFQGDSAGIVARTVDGEVIAIPAAPGGHPSSLGRYPALGGTSPDGTRVRVGSGASAVILALTNDSGANGGASPTASRIDAGIVQAPVVHPPGANPSATELVLPPAKGTTPLRLVYRTLANQGKIESFTTSANGQYLAVTVDPNVATSVSDGYLVDPHPIAVSTVFVDVASGLIVGSVAGCQPLW